MKRNLDTNDETEMAYVKRSIEFARRCNDRANGIYYVGELCGPGGMSYWLLPPAGTSDEVIEEAENVLRASQDVVRLDVIFVPPDMVADDERDKPSASIEAKIAKIRDVVNNGFNKVDGVAVDSFSASAIIAVYDALNDENKKKFGALSIYKMADVAFKLCK